MTMKYKEPFYSRFNLRMIVFLVFASIQLPLLISLGHWGYRKLKIEVKEKFTLLRHQTESNILNSLHFVDSGMQVIRSALEDDLLNNLRIFTHAYEKSNGNPKKIDLLKLKERFGDGHELHIISADGVIVYSTLAQDLNLDFKNWPLFYKNLNRMLKDGRPKVGRLSSQTREDRFKIYGYSPTPDKKYILEIGLRNKQFIKFTERFDLANMILTIRNFNPFLVDLNIYDESAYYLGPKTNKRTPSSKLKYVLKVLKQKNTLEVFDKQKNLKTRYIYSDTLHEKDVSQTGFVVELVYDLNRISQERWEKSYSYFALVVLIIIINLLLNYFFSTFLLRPIQRLINDVKSISTGNLDHKIGSIGQFDLNILGEQVNKMVAALRQKISEVSELSSNLISSQEEERQKLAKDLHDSVSQTIDAGKLKLTLAARKDPFDRKTYEDGVNLLGLAGEELRQIYTGLFPSILADLGLEKALSWYGKKIFGDENLGGVEFTLNYQIPSSLARYRQLHIFRIVQEISANVLKHSQAKQFKLSLEEVEDEIELLAYDDGIGFENVQLEQAKFAHFGLRNIQIRVAELKGYLEIKTGQGKGTTYKIRFPIRVANDDNE